MRGKSKPSDTQDTDRRDADVSGTSKADSGQETSASGTAAAPAAARPGGDAAGKVPNQATTEPAGDPNAAGSGQQDEAVADAAGADPDDAEVLDGQVLDAQVVDAEVVEPDAATAAGPADTAAAPPAEPGTENHLGAELGALRTDLDEMTKDLQRVSAEYANYRRRVDRDRGLIAEQATGTVLAALLPALDDLDRAREHGDLVGPFGSVAEQLLATLGKFGLTSFGEKGDPFDPTRHEAVAHQTSEEVTEPTCVEILRRGYMLGDRLLRAALVAVAEPQ